MKDEFATDFRKTGISLSEYTMEPHQHGNYGNVTESVSPWQLRQKK